ncbi:MAG: hypothetical protein HYR51_20660 [Candidatus Rokubacteria bacterium]|nr:hypothetical protein [Candidatus Rokubacteria bacterium]
MASFPVRSARELMDDDFHARWTQRESVGPIARVALAAILDRFVADGGPVALDSLALGHDRGTVEAAVAELDAADLVATRDGRVLLAYPFASAPTGFAVDLPGGRERHACCAIDALGIAPMLGAPTRVRARCHHCADAVDLAVEPTGPIGRSDVMAWVGRRDTLRQKACDGL